MSRLDFADRILVGARVVRVIGYRGDDGAMRLRQSIPPRDHGRILSEDLDGERAWPGLAVPAEVVEAPEGYELEPTPDAERAYVRLRRIVSPVPLTGVVVGWTYKVEGTLRGNDLGGPGRRVHLLEVAVAPGNRRGRAQLVLGLPLDLGRLNVTNDT